MKTSQRLSHPDFASGSVSQSATARRRRAAFALHTLVLGLSAFAVPAALHAASDSWDGSTDATWATATNWLTDVAAPGSGETATFNGAGNGNTTISLGSGVTVGSVIFDTSSAAAYTIGSGGAGSQTLTLGTTGNAITMNSTVVNDQTVNANLALSTTGSYTLTNNSTTNTLSIGGGISASTTGTKVLNVVGAGNSAISGAITAGSGVMNMVKLGTGTLTLSGGGAWGTAGITTYGGTNSAVLLGGTTKISSGTYTSTGEFVVGGVLANGGAGVNTNLTMDGGALTISSYLSLGRGNGVGGVSSDIVLNNSAAITAANFSAGYNNGNTSNLAKGSLTLNNSSSLTISGNGVFVLGEANGAQAMTATLNDSSQLIASGTGVKYIGGYNGVGGTGTLTLNSGTTTNFGSGITYVGYKAGTGVLNANGGTFTSTGEMRVGGSDANGAFTGGTGTVNVTSGTVTVGALTIARGNNNAALINGTVNQSGGTLTSTGDVIVGYAGAANTGKINLSGGTFNVGTSATKWLMVGTWDTAKGELNINSGALNLNTNSAIKMNRQTGTGANVITQNGGTVTFYSDNATTVGGSGYLDMQAYGAAGSSNTYNLNGGVLTVPRVSASTRTSGDVTGGSTVTVGTRTFNFNGGTLKAASSTYASTFFNFAGNGGTAVANVRNGGAIIDSNGFSVTASQALLHSNVGGDNATDGGLTKNGLGTLTLSGANTYTGPTAVNAGTLALASAGTLTSTSYSIANGATFDTSAKASFDLSTVATTIGLDASTAGFFNAGTGAVTLGNGLSLSFSTGSLIAGTTYNLFDYGSHTGDFSSVSLSGSVSASLVRSGDIWTGSSGAYGFSLNQADGILTVSAVPEPSTCAALAGVLGLGLAAYRRRRR